MSSAGGFLQTTALLYAPVGCLLLNMMLMKNGHHPPHTSVWGQSRKKPVKAEGKETEKESIRGACSVLPGFPVFLETGRWEVVIWRWCHCPGWKMFVTYSMWNISKFIISTFRTGGCSGERREELLKLLWHWTVHQPSLPLSSCLE